MRCPGLCKSAESCADALISVAAFFPASVRAELLVGMNDDRHDPAPAMRFPSRRHALLYLVVLAFLVMSVGWGSVTEHASEATCPETASAADCPTDPVLMLPILLALACGACLSWLARRTARSLAASGVSMKGPKGMSAWMTVELFLLVGLFVPMALRQLRESPGKAGT